jgi:ribosomal protein L11 methyltransferase
MTSILPKGSGAPIETLFIYYIEGRLNTESRMLGEHFIGNWVEDGFSFLFFSQSADDIVRAILARTPEVTLLDQYQMAYADWQGAQFSRFDVGPFTIIPSWEAPTQTSIQNTKQHEIVLNPGVVFGNGLHPTTRDCLEAIALVFDTAQIETALDLGTGSGLLGLSVARMGCKKVLAVDNNLLAAATAKENVRLNHLDRNMIVVQGNAQKFIDFSSDLVVTNIHYDIMKKVIAASGFLTKKWFVLSGLLRSQFSSVMQTLGSYPVSIVKIWENDGVWFTCLGRHKA